MCIFICAYLSIWCVIIVVLFHPQPNIQHVSQQLTEEILDL